MNVLITLLTLLMIFGVILILGVLFFSYLKYLKKTRYPNWKFPDYISVGYAQYLFNKYIKRTIK